MSDSTPSRPDTPGEHPIDETRVAIYESLMEAQEDIAEALRPRGVGDELVVNAMDVADLWISDAERREDLYLSSLAAYVQQLGGYLELTAVFGDEQIVVSAEPTRRR